MDRIELRALGKINLGLDVIGKRDDGYHDVRMVMQTVNLYDQIILERKKEPGISMETNLSFLPVDGSNLAYRAARMLIDEFMNRMFGLGLSFHQLQERGVTLGADVPYCIMRGTAFAEGIGEILTPLDPCPKCSVLLAKPGISVSTKLVYGRLDSLTDYAHPDIYGILDGIREQDIRKIASCMGNVLENVTVEEYPVIEKIKEIMKQEGALGAMMSGSGPTVFGLYEERDAAKAAADRIKDLKLARQVYVTSIHHARRK